MNNDSGHAVETAVEARAAFLMGPRSTDRQYEPDNRIFALVYFFMA